MEMPVLFVGHGNPMNAIEENEFVNGFRSIAKQLPMPEAILCISAHWETRGTQLTAMQQPRTIHDFGGFPEKLYQVTYPAPGSPQLASEIGQMITSTPVINDYAWGLDHGCWSVIKHFYPQANIPVVEMSLDQHKTPRQHYDMAKELKALRQQNVLIVGSGNIVHNLRLIDWQHINTPDAGYDWAVEVNTKVKQLIDNHHHDKLINYRNQGSSFQMAIPTPEHFLPLLYILALQDDDDTVAFFNDKAIGGSLTMTSVYIG
jgi:4,5-DOPA dioxygenase extradiol